MKKNSLTIGELLIVMIVIAILASIGITQYQQALWSSKVSKGRYAISLIAQAEKIIQAEGFGDAAKDGYIEVKWTPPRGTASMEVSIGTGVSGIDLRSLDADTDWSYSVNVPLVGASYYGPHAPSGCDNPVAMNYDLRTGVFQARAGCW